MDGSQFDRLTSRLATRRLSRRAVAASGSGLAVATLTGLWGVSAQDATPVPVEESTPVGAEEGTAFLFVQLFDEGTWFPKPGEDGVYLLTLTGAAAQTLYFSDRPERIVGTVDTPQFLEALGFTPSNPPNAALVVRTPEGERDVLVIELFDPVYTEDINDPGNVTVTYEARVLEAYHGDGLSQWATEQADAELPEQFSDISLFIDDCPDITKCVAVSTEWYGCCSHKYVGPIPGGPYAQWWSWQPLGCFPRLTERELADICNHAYEDQCWTDRRCWPSE